MGRLVTHCKIMGHFTSASQIISNMQKAQYSQQYSVQIPAKNQTLPRVAALDLEITDHRQGGAICVKIYFPYMDMVDVCSASPILGRGVV